MKHLKMMAAVAGLSMLFAAGQANATALITVSEGYNDDITIGALGDYLNLQDTSGHSLHNIVITGGVAGSKVRPTSLGNTQSLSFYLGDAPGNPGAEGAATVTFTYQGTPEKLIFKDILGIVGTPSGATPVPVTGAVPEPASWLMMLLGFGMLGAVLRGTKRNGQAQHLIA